MSSELNHHGVTQATIERISRLKGEPGWMTAKRLEAWSAYEQLAETEAREVALDAIQAFVEPPTQSVPSSQWPIDLQAAMEERGDEEGLIVQRDSTILSRSITKEQAKRGVVYMDLDMALKTKPELVQRYFGAQVLPDDRFSALHTAFWSGGSFLYVPANVQIELPFHTCFWLSTESAGVFPHTIIVAERDSQVSLVDEYLSPTWAKPGLSAGAVEIWAASGARVTYYHLQNWGESIYHVCRQSSQVADTGRLLSFSVTLGGTTGRTALGVESISGGSCKNLSAAIEPGSQLSASLEDLLRKVPEPAMREKLREYVLGKVTGQRPSWTLHRTAEWHPEVRV